MKKLVLLMILALMLNTTFQRVHAEPLTVIGIIAGGVVLVKKAGAVLVIATKSHAFKKATHVAAHTAFEISKLPIVGEEITDRSLVQDLEYWMNMSSDELLDWCHALGGGMATTPDVRESAHGPNLIFGLSRPEYTQQGYPYAGWICISH